MKLLLEEPYPSRRAVLQLHWCACLPLSQQRSTWLTGSAGDVQAPGHSLRIDWNEIIHFPSAPDTHDHGVSA
jgi:hypothetical protein